jgi:NADPH:quinone reductase-like Zn-dependent oxidoreductase
LAGGKDKYSSKPLVVLGGATSVGQNVIQAAKLSGFSPIIATASLKHTDYLKTLGATHVLDRSLSAADLKSKVKEIVSSPVDLVYDAVSIAETENAGYDLLSEDGKLIIVTSNLVDKDKVTEKKQIIGIFGSFAIPATRELGKEFYSQLSKLVEAGDIKVHSSLIDVWNMF